MRDSNLREEQDDICRPWRSRDFLNSQPPTSTTGSWCNATRCSFTGVWEGSSDASTGDGTRDSDDATPVRNRTTVLFPPKARAASVATVFPNSKLSDRLLEEADTPRSIYSAQPKSAARKQSFFRKHYRRLKEIHDNGPPGEAQMCVVGIKGYLRDKDIGIAFEMCSPKQEDDTISETSADHQSILAPTFTNGDKARARQDSLVSNGNISCTSCEVPVKMRRTILEMNVNKPLPAYPPLKAIPTQGCRNGEGTTTAIDKSFPGAPIRGTVSKKKSSRNLVDISPIVAPWPIIRTQTVGVAPSVNQFRSPQRDNRHNSKRTQHMAQRTWLDDVSQSPKLHLPFVSTSNQSKANKARDALKATISHPIPITSPVDDHSPDFSPQPCSASAKVKSKESPSSATWFGKLAHPTLPTMHAIYKSKKRPDSDDSFTCQGLSGGNVYAQIIMGNGALMVHDDGPVVTMGKAPQQHLVHEALIAGQGGNGIHSNTDRAGADQRRARR